MNETFLLFLNSKTIYIYIFASMFRTDPFGSYSIIQVAYKHINIQTKQKEYSQKCALIK